MISILNLLLPIIPENKNQEFGISSDNNFIETTLFIPPTGIVYLKLVELEL